MSNKILFLLGVLFFALSIALLQTYDMIRPMVDVFVTVLGIVSSIIALREFSETNKVNFFKLHNRIH